MDLQFRTPLMSFIFFPETFSDVGGWVGGSGAGAQAAIPPPPPPGNKKLWPVPAARAKGGRCGRSTAVGTSPDWPPSNAPCAGQPPPPPPAISVAGATCIAGSQVPFVNLRACCALGRGSTLDPCATRWPLEGGGGGIPGAVSFVWETSRFTLVATFTTRNPGASTAGC